MKEIKIYEIPNIDFVERIDDPYIGMIFYVSDIDAYYSVKTLKEINGINMKGSKVVEYVIDDYADFGTGSGGGSGLTATQLSNIAKIPAIQSTVDALPNNYASKNHKHSEYASSSHRHDASEIDNLPSGGGGSGEGLTSTQKQQLQTAYEHSQSTHIQSSDIPSKTSDLTNDSNFVTDSEMNSALSTKANTSDIPSLNGYATETFVTSKISEAQLSGGEVDLSAYATKTYADNAVSTALDGHTFKFLTQAEYDSLETKDPLVGYYITDATDSGGGLTTEQAQNIAQVPTLKSYVDAITIIKDNSKAIKSYEPLATNTLAETGYTNNYNFQANALNVNDYCYMVFMYDITSVLNTSPNEVFKIKFNIPKFGVITKTGFGCNLTNAYPIDQVTYSEVFNIENDTELICNIKTRNIGMKYALFQIGFKADNITDVYGTVSFDYYVNNEVQELFYTGAYASPESLTMDNSDVGIMSISNITTIKDKDFEIPFEIKNIDMASVEVKLVVDGAEEIVSISKVSETSYSIPYNFNTIGTKICSIKITSGATEYSSNNFNIVVKDSSSVSVANIFINPDKILINGNTLSTAITDLENLIKSYSSSLYGKNICFIGDSIIELDLFCTQLVNKTGCKIQNLGVSGSGWIANNGGNNFNKRIDLIEGTPDLIVFYGSCNDLNSGDLGKLGDLGTTYYGVVRETLEKVINKYKHTTKYAVITPLPAHYSNNDNRGSFVDGYNTGSASVKLTQENMSLAQREVAGALSIPCLDLYHNSNCFAIFPDGTVTGDGLHYATNNIAPVRTIQRFLEGII